MQEKSKRIAKNTFVLYIRMILMMFINFYTTRVILDTLGVDDFGIYNVVGGFVGMFSMISGSLNAACARFLNFALGKGDMNHLKNVFSTEVSIQVLLALFVFVLSESVGLWFLNHKMVIPPDRLFAANWCFQLSVFNFCIGLTMVPYTASVIAHEKMDTFAYFSIYDAVMQLVITYLLVISPIDKLIFYASFLWLNAWVMRVVYHVYCKRHFEECTYHWMLDKPLVKEIFSFSGWNLIGASSAVLRDQGCNVMLNLFFGPSVNAARGIGNKIHGTAVGFVSNFLSAMTPQITQSYSSGDREYMNKLIFKGAKLSFFMMLFMAVPLIINARYILTIWLKEVPDDSVLFGQLAFVMTMASVLSNPLITAQLATGKIKKYQIIVGGLQMLNLPVSYIFLKLGCFPQVVVVVAIVLELLCLSARLVLLRSMINLDSKAYLKQVVFRVFLVSAISVPIPAILAYYTDESFLRLIYTSLVSMLMVGICIVYVGCDKSERIFVFSKVNLIIRNKFSHSND